MIEDVVCFVAGGVCVTGLFWAFLTFVGYGSIKYKFVTFEQIKAYPKGTVVYTVFCGKHFAQNKKFLLAGFRVFESIGLCVVGTDVVTGKNVVVRSRNSFVVELKR